MTPNVLIRLPQVMQKTGLKKSRIYQLIKDKLFPEQVKIGERSVAWVENEINNWIEEQIKKRGGQ